MPKKHEQPAPEVLPSGSGEADQAVENYRKRLASVDERTMPAMLEQEELLREAISGAPPTTSRPLVGTWTIVIRGSGQHHNGADADANRLAGEFVSRLREHGHEIAEATFGNGSNENVLTPEGKP